MEPSTAVRQPSRQRRTAALAALALSAFVVGTSELVVVGLLPLIARDVRVSVAASGQLVTAYALGIAVGGPMLSALTTRVSRRLLLLVTVAAYVAGNLLTAVSADMTMVLVVRVATGAVHGLFIGVASIVAAGLVPPEQRGRAMSMVFGGIAVSTVVGVPLGTLLGQALGWRAAFLAIAALGAAALACAAALVPAVAGRVVAGLAVQARSAFAPRVLAMLGVGVLLLGGQFTAFTYLAPYLQAVVGVTGGGISAFLLAYGVASAIGTFLGGRLADRGASTTLLACNAVLVVALGGLWAAGASVPVAVLALGVWGLAGLGLVPSLQLRVVALAGSGRDLAATLGASGVNAGIALGALVGGSAVAAGGVHTVALVAAAVCAVALPATLATRLLKVPAERAAPPPSIPAAAPAIAVACRGVCLVDSATAAATIANQEAR